MTARAQQGWPYLDKTDPWSSHAQIRALLAGLPAGARLLDVGAATGTLGRLCVDSGFVVHGLEPNPAWVAAARPYYAVLWCGTLEESADAALRGYDAVVLADVLEHMADPAAALRRLVALQPSGARFLISVPNVANLWVRLNLLVGRFDYSERGILDRTHLRFFTRRSLLALLAEVGLHVEVLRATPIPLNLVAPWFERSAVGRTLHASLAGLTMRWPTLLGYQFVVRATAKRC